MPILMTKAAYTVQDLTNPKSEHRLFSRSTFYRLKKEGLVKVRYVGRRQIVTAEDREALLASLPTETRLAA